MNRNVPLAYEQRTYAFTECEVRDGQDGAVLFDGVASTVDQPYPVRDLFGTYTEIIKPGAYDGTINNKKADVALFLSHQHNSIPLATRASGTLDLAADPHLRVSARMNPARHDVNDVREGVKDGVLPQMSIGFSVPKGQDKWNADMTQRTIHQVKLVETSIVWQGANDRTAASVRSIADLIADIPLDADTADLQRAIAHLEGLLDERAVIAVHHTPTVDVPWDKNAQVAKLHTPVTGPVARGMFAWYDQHADDGDGDGWPDAKSAYKFPHHEVGADGQPGAANLAGVRNALSRIPQAIIPDGDRPGVERHLRSHLADSHRAIEEPEVTELHPELAEAIYRAARRRA